VTARPVRVPKPVQQSILWLEEQPSLDRVGGWLTPITSRLATGTVGDVLRGKWLGHALHPMLTDLPIGCWTSSFILDVCGGRRSRPASERLIALGLLAVVPTAAAGLVDWHETGGDERRRVGVAHALTNSIAAVLYLLSWRARRRDRYSMGLVLAAGAAVVVTIGGHLGGHLVFARHTGMGERGTDDIDVIPPEEHVLDGLIGA